MILHFNRKLVEQLLAHTNAAPEHSALYEQKKTEAPGLWLVGDQGVYLMSNGKPGLLRPGTHPKGVTPNIVAKAKEVDDTKLEFDVWWQAKRASFGGDDGAEFFPAADLEGALATYRPDEDLMLDVTPEQMAVIRYQPRSAAAGSPTRPSRQRKGL